MEIKRKLRIILDTNVLLVSISSKSKYHWIFKGLVNGEYELYISNEILTEYEEVIAIKFNSEVAKGVVKMLLVLPNVYKVDIFYRWNLIEMDADDNKFADCYVCADGDYIITHDKHFNILKTIDFPMIEIMKVEEFRDKLFE